MQFDLLGHRSEESFARSLSRELQSKAQPSLLTRPRALTSPRLSYGRHKGPARTDSRPAAVAIMIYPRRDTGRFSITLTRRPVTLSHHGGQICLPGGKIESGETPVQAALREYEEELGIAAESPQLLGTLCPIYVFGSDNLVQTLVIRCDAPRNDWKPDPVEVDQVIEIPLESLARVGRTAQTTGDGAGLISRKQIRTGKIADGSGVFQYEFGYQAIELKDFRGVPFEIWGATAMLLEEFAGCLQRCQVVDR